MSAVFKQAASMGYNAASTVYNTVSSGVSTLYSGTKYTVFTALTSQDWAIELPRKAVISYALATCCYLTNPAGVAAFMLTAMAVNRLVLSKPLAPISWLSAAVLHYFAINPLLAKVSVDLSCNFSSHFFMGMLFWFAVYMIDGSINNYAGGEVRNPPKNPV